MRSSRSRRMSGPRLTTQTSRSGTGPGPRTSPVGWTCPPGRPGCGSSSARSARTRGRSCGHRPRRAPVHRVRHRRQERPARGPGTAAPPPGPLRGPLRQGHQAAEPAAEGVRPQPALVRDRGPGLRAAGLDPAARRGGRPAGGSPGACGCACSPSRGAWSAAAAACGSASRTLALGRPDHHRGHPPAGHPFRMPGHTIRRWPGSCQA